MWNAGTERFNSQLWPWFKRSGAGCQWIFSLTAADVTPIHAPYRTPYDPARFDHWQDYLFTTGGFSDHRMAIAVKIPRITNPQASGSAEPS
jgi:hypothetical protein